MAGARPLPPAIAALLTAAIAGCHQHPAYDVEVRNRTDRVMVARVESQRRGDDPRAVCTRYIDPGSRGTMLVRTQSGARMTLEVLEPERTDPWPSPARVELKPGKTVLIARREADPGAPAQRFRLEPPPR